MTNTTQDLREALKGCVRILTNLDTIRHLAPDFPELDTALRVLAETADAARRSPVAAEPVARGLDLYDEIESDLPYLFGRASNEGHTAGQELARQVQEKMRKARTPAEMPNLDGSLRDDLIAALDAVGIEVRLSSEFAPGAPAMIYGPLDHLAILIEKLCVAPAHPSDAQAAADAALEKGAKLCDQKYELRASTGHIREASTARNLAEDIRAMIGRPVTAQSKAAGGGQD
jgi:hypothetical protein